MRWISFILLLTITGCGYTSRTNEMTGQAKKVVNQTPIVCDNRVDAEVSLGVMRNGVGSMSTEDKWFTVPDKKDQAVLKDAAEKGAIVKVIYDVKRFTWCWEDHIVTKVEIVQ